MRRVTILCLALPLAIACSNDHWATPWQVGESGGDAAVGDDAADGGPVDSQIADDAEAEVDAPAVDPGCTPDEAGFVVTDTPALIDGYWSGGEVIGDCIHQVGWLHFAADETYARVLVDGGYCYEEGRYIHRCSGSWSIEKSSGNLYEACTSEASAPSSRVPADLLIKGTWAVHKQPGQRARLTRMAFRREEAPGGQQAWQRRYVASIEDRQGHSYHPQILAALEMDRAALAAAERGEVATTVVLDVSAFASQETPDGQSERAEVALRRELEATLTPMPGAQIELTVHLGEPSRYVSEWWHNWLRDQPEYQRASDLAKGALLEAFYPVLYLDAHDPSVAAGHPPRQSWTAICDPCDEYAESFPDQMAQMCQ